MTKYIPHNPSEKQTVFLNLTEREAFYGGAASGGKSDALLMGALQWVDVPGYAAIIFRKTLRDHQLAGALLSRAKQWLNPWSNEVRFNGDTYTFTFPSGATVTFGYLQTIEDRNHYLSTEFQYIAFDELTTFADEADWDELNGRLRKTIDLPMPLRIRGASNPGGPGHQWVMEKFIEPGTTGIPFVPATVDDNPFVDKDYAAALESTKDPVRREQLRRGDWHILPEGKVILRDWFGYVEVPVITKRRVRTWDFAATEAEHGQQKKKKDPDYTAGGLYSMVGSTFTVEDMVRGRWSPADVSDKVKYVAEQVDGPDVPIWIEVEPGSAGLLVVQHFKDIILGGKFQVFGKHATGDKKTRIRAWAGAAQKGNMFLKAAPWNLDYVREAVALGTSDEVHDDQMDATSLAYQVLTLEGPNYEDWREYYADRKKGVGVHKPYMRKVQTEEEIIAILEEREAKARARIELRKAQERASHEPRQL